MSDANLFLLGCLVFVIAAAGAFLFVYGRFRSAFLRENGGMVGVQPDPVRPTPLETRLP